MPGRDGLNVAVLGAGIVGAACARALADEGARVTVYDPKIGRAAGSFAAAGLLMAEVGHLQPPAWLALARRSMELWAGFAPRHPQVELREIGLALLDDEAGWTAWRHSEGLPCELVDWNGRHVLLAPEVSAVRPQRCASALLGEIPVRPPPMDPVRALAARADLVVIAAGAWATPLLAEAGIDVSVRPRRGQMLRFDRGDLPFAIYSDAHERVAVPRDDGSVVVGTTLEDVGFDQRTDDRTLDLLESWARSEIPGLGQRVDAWAGFRPQPNRPLPLIDRIAPKVIAAVGHYRDGILLAPATAELVRDLALDRPPVVAAGPFSHPS